MIDVTCVISTKDRYWTTLPLALTAICNQLHKPKELLLFDDGEHKDLRGDTIYSHIFNLLSFNGIEWKVVFGEGRGQVANHIKSLEMAKHEWIYRLDDDNVPESDVLQKLVSNIKDDVGAIGGLVIDRIRDLPSIASNKIEDIYLGMNEQWFVHPKDSKQKEVDHLYSSFLYRKDIAKYCSDLSPVGHREETILTYEMKRKGFKVVLDPSAKTWHFCNPSGGIRAHKNIEFAAGDERIFLNRMKEWGVSPREYAFAVLNNGIGDHYVFKSNMESYFKRNEGKKCILFTCYPEVFEDVDVQTASIYDAEVLFGNLDRWNVYKWMIDRSWRVNIDKAFQKIYDLNSTKEKTIIKGDGDSIVISPFSFSSGHAKSYPYWNDLVKKIKTLGIKIIQIGSIGEEVIDGVDEIFLGQSFKSIEKLIEKCRIWISGDSFLQHLVNCMKNPVKGVVIFGVSNPDLFGYPYNRNIVKSSRYFRKNQFDGWKDCKRVNESFVGANEVFESIVDSM